jgi:isocitrate/isopropylmalate dehydrogenase
VANPLGAIQSAAMMLAHLGFQEHAGRIDAAVLAAVRAKQLTQDVGGTMGTREVGDWVAKRVT